MAASFTLRRNPALRGQLARAQHDGVAAGLQEWERLSNARVPDRTGALQRSSSTRVDGPGHGTISYSDEAAVPQHERLDYRHDDGEAKFLERSAHAGAGQIGSAVAAAMRRVIGG